VSSLPDFLTSSADYEIRSPLFPTDSLTQGGRPSARISIHIAFLTEAGGVLTTARFLYTFAY
jgi:hypothetical protein